MDTLIERLGELSESTKIALAEIAECDDCGQLLKWQEQYARRSVEDIVLLAAVVRRLDEIGTPADEKEIPQLPLLRLVAHGQLLAEILFYYGGLPILDNVRQLPIPVQKQFADRKPVKVALLGGDHLMVAPEDLTLNQRRQVFSRGSIRSESQQIAYLRDKTQEERAKPSAPDKREAVVNKKKRTIVIAGVEWKVHELLRLIEEATS